MYFLRSIWKYLHLTEFLTRAAPVVPVTNMRYVQNTAATVATYCIVKMVGWIAHCVMQFSKCNAEHCSALQSWLDGSVAGKTADNCIQFNCPAIYTIFTIFSAKIIHIYNIICKYLSYLQYLQISLIFTIFKRSLIFTTSSANIINIYKIIFNDY